MPRYDYRCTACRELFEVNRQVGQAGDENCPVCGAPAKRVFSPVGVHFKGAGFHNTDYKPKPAAEGACPPAAANSPACNG